MTYPWLTVWLKPGDTIERVLAGHPQRSVWSLVALGGAANFAAGSVAYGWSAGTVGWPAMAAIVCGGAAYSIIALYVQAWCLRWSGRALGGKTSAKQLRVLVAWGYFLPLLVGSAISLAISIWLNSSNGGTSKSQVYVDLVQSIVLVWSIIIVLRMIVRTQHFGMWRAVGNGTIALLLASVLLTIPLSIRAFLFQPFNTPSGSNKPTLLVGDYFFVSKYAYGYSRFSLPFSPRLFSGRIWAAEPQRGDMVVFRLPRDTSIDYVKRIVGLPNDRIQMIDGVLHINGTAVKTERIEDFVDNEDGKPMSVKQWQETLPNGATYATLDLIANGFADNTAVYTVPPGYYFVLGDNRDNSTDSRFAQQHGMIPFENLIGRVAFIYYSVAPNSGAIRYDRIGMPVR
jgi:signal peptidase I